MSAIKELYLNGGRKRADSDTTNNGASEGGSYFRGKRTMNAADAY